MLETSAAKSHPVSVLVAEDCDDNRFLLAAYCRGTPYDLTFVEDGQQAVTAFQERLYQIVVMDILMPVLDGLAATRLIRTFETDRDRARTPIFALSANAMPHDIALTLEAGCDLHLAKPISRNSFLSALEQWKQRPPSQPPPPLAHNCQIG